MSPLHSCWCVTTPARTRARFTLRACTAHRQKSNCTSHTLGPPLTFYKTSRKEAWKLKKKKKKTPALALRDTTVPRAKPTFYFQRCSKVSSQEEQSELLSPPEQAQEGTARLQPCWGPRGLQHEDPGSQAGEQAPPENGPFSVSSRTQPECPTSWHHSFPPLPFQVSFRLVYKFAQAEVRLC